MMTIKKAQKLAFAFVLAAACARLQAQTNTFPASGNVGIGTTTPTQALNVYGNFLLNNGQYSTLLATYGNGAGSFLQSYDQSNSVYKDMSIYGADIIFQTAVGSSLFERMRIAPSGNVGIGTTTPSNHLVVAASPATGYQLELNDIRPAAQNVGGQMTFSGNTNGSASSGSFASILGLKENAAISNYQGYLAFYTNTTGAVPGGVAEKMRITSNGNVGIGATNPLSLLQVGGGPNTWGALPANTQLYIPGIQQSDGSVANSIAMGVDVNANATMAIATRATTGDLYPIFMDIRSGNVPVATFSSAGNVGIGTASPGYKLDVIGTIHASEVIVDTSGADYVFKPNYKLMPLSQIEQAIKKDQHLPGIPSAQAMSSSGMNMGDLQTKLLAKIEELTLHQIEQEKRLNEQSKDIEQLQKENIELRGKLTK